MSANTLRRLRSYSLIAILFALCLLGAQQAAYAHYIGHIVSAGGYTTPLKGDDGKAPPHDCPTCAAFAGLTSAPPTAVTLVAITPADAILFSDIPASYLPAPSAPPYPARAPPVVL